MDKQEHIFRPGQRVRLSRDGSYQWATVGSEAVVKKIQYDEYGYPMAFVEWDKDHWTYNGEEDRWVFQSHFEPIGELMSDDSDFTPENLAKLAEALKGMGFSFNGQESAEADNNEDKKNHERASEVATKNLEGAEAMLVITVHRVVEDGIPMLIPQVVQFSHSEEGILGIEAQLGTLSEMSHMRLIEDHMVRVLNEKEGQ